MAHSSPIPYYDLEAEMKHRVSKHITPNLKKFGTNKKEAIGWSHSMNKKGQSPTLKILGCTAKEFLDHIESKFLDGMSWDNRNIWDLDHIVPISSAKDAKDDIKLCHFTNYQPLWYADNIRKSNKI